MEDALTAVIESEVKGINGFLITVTNAGNQFSYKRYMKTYMPGRTYTGGIHNIEVYGTVQEGGYTVHVFSNDPNNIITVHLRQNRYGLIYSIKEGGYLETEVYKDVDEHEFNEITEKLHGMKPPIILSSKQKSFFERGNKSAEKREFENAIAFYELGLKEKERSLIARLHFNKGICQYHLRKYNEAQHSFYEAVSIDNSLQTDFIGFMSQFRNRSL